MEIKTQERFPQWFRTAQIRLAAFHFSIFVTAVFINSKYAAKGPRTFFAMPGTNRKDMCPTTGSVASVPFSSRLNLTPLQVSSR